ncbi:TPA: hypothetical protein NJZ01_004522 [Vibrio parahaemolyticus]|nr:hypothetical protein [Vibrio parahaemolyticus]
MIQKKLKTISAITLTVASFASFAGITYTGNQGVKTSKFDPTYFSGQWELETSRNPSLEALERRPNFIVMYPSDRNVAQARLEQLQTSTTRTEYRHALKIQDFTRDILYHMNTVIYFNKNYTQEDLQDSRFEYKAREKSSDNYYDFRDTYDKNLIALETYNKNNAISTTEVLAYYDYLNLPVVPTKYYSKIVQAKAEHLKKFNFDFEKEMDYFMVNSDKELMGVDIISADKFILYKLSGKYPKVSIFVRPEKIHEVKTYTEFFKELIEK